MNTARTTRRCPALTPALIESLKDSYEMERGLRSPSEVRRIQLDCVCVDENLMGLVLPSRQCRALGLQRRRAADSGIALCDPARITILDRECAANRDPKTVMEQFKAWCTRKLKELQRERGQSTDIVRENWWTERGSKRVISDENSLEAAVLYVLDAQ